MTRPPLRGPALWLGLALLLPPVALAGVEVDPKIPEYGAAVGGVTSMRSSAAGMTVTVVSLNRKPA